MARPVDALITGFVKSPVLLEASLAPLRQLHSEGHIRAIHYVTWDDPALDAFVAPLAAMPQICLTRVPDPGITGTPSQRGVAYQIENLRTGLGLLDGDGLVLKSRPDFVARADFLRDKIDNFDSDCAVPERLSLPGVQMPAPVLKNKIWIPWADSNQPFFYEDALFLGAHGDIEKLVTPLCAADRTVLGDPDCGSYAHVVRFAEIFVKRWPIFAEYRKHYRCFVNDFEYRRKLVPMMLAEGFFWHLLIAHAWILHSQFHVDAGEPNDLRFFANNVNKDADWSRPETLRLANPYDNVTKWRDVTRPGEALYSVQGVYGRLMDDDWHAALFTQDLPDLSRETLRDLMRNVADYGDGRLRDVQRDFYRKLEQFRQREWQSPVAKAS